MDLLTYLLTGNKEQRVYLEINGRIHLASQRQAAVTLAVKQDQRAGVPCLLISAGLLRLGC